MKKILTVIFGFCSLVILVQLNSCKEDEGITDPETHSSTLTGQIDHSFTSDEISKLTVAFGEEEYELDEDGKFTLSYNEEVPGMVILLDDEDNPLLLGLVPNPSKSQECKINFQSTALSLVFMNPFICTSLPSDAEQVVDRIKMLPELNVLENVLQSKFSLRREAITTDDNEIKNALKNVIVSYLSSITYDSTSIIPKQKNLEEEAIIISPGNIVSGHQVMHKSEDNFLITNWYGRWAKCITATDTMYLPPNNDMLSLKPWQPSEREFKMNIIPNDPPKEIDVYGLGWSNQTEATWDELTSTEKDHVEFAGRMTVLIEFLPRILSLVTNCPFTTVRGNNAPNFIITFNRYMIQYGKNFERAKLLLADGHYMDYVWTMMKEITMLLATEDEFRNFVMQALKINLSKAAFEKFAKMVLLPLNVLSIGDDLTGLCKSVLALYDAGYKTTFKVHSEEINFGNVTGNVYDKESGKGIQNVVVKLLGDEGNPMNPNYTYTTDGGGGFWFENIMEGEKTLQLTHEEYGGKSVDINVTDGETTQVTIILSKEKGTLQGKVLNEIFMKNGVDPANFNKECYLTVTEIGGNNYYSSFWISEYKKGEYSLELTPGTFEIVAHHEDYLDAKTTVTITGDEVTQAEDLILKPDGMMEGNIRYDIDFDGQFEYDYTFKAETFGSMYENDMGDCPNEGNRSGLGLIGFNSFESIEIIIDTAQINGRNMYDLGGIWYCGCNEPLSKTTVVSATKRFKCTHEEYGYELDLIFGFNGDPDDAPCDCGISNPGTIYISKFGKNLGDVIEGDIQATLPGWKNCHCSCCDDDGNYTVDCAKSYLNIKFKVLVGSFYDDIIPKNMLTDNLKKIQQKTFR